MSEERDTASEQAEAYSAVEGFYEDTGGAGRGMYFSIFDGSICRKSKVELPDWEGPIKTTHPKTKAEINTWVTRFDKIVARVVGVSKNKREFDDGGKVINWNVLLLAAGKKATLQFVWAEPVLKRFLKVAPNIDFDMPLLISAFSTMKQGKRKQAVSFRQGTSNNPDDWVKVEEYWKRELGPDNKPLDGTPSKGADGTIMPQPIHDDDDDSWDYKIQNKFLQQYFIDNVKPKIDAVGEKLGVAQMEDTDNSAPEFAGPAQEAPRVVTELPAQPEMTSVGDAMTAEQNVAIKAACKTLGREAEAASQKFCTVAFHKLSKDGAAYLLYRLNKIIAKQAPPPPPPVAEDDDEDWDAAEAPVAPAPMSAQAPIAKAADPDDDGEDIPF